MEKETCSSCGAINSSSDECKGCEAPTVGSSIRRVAKIVKGYCGTCEDKESDILDLLIDIMLYCKDDKLDFDKVLKSANRHYDVESKFQDSCVYKE
ncbi:MAG: hypothetical protein AABY32_01230 [Nanoarchaeota archaeon]